MSQKTEYVTTVQPLWRNRQSIDFERPDGIYLTETAPVMPPPGERWVLHSVQPLPLFGEPKLLCLWRRRPLYESAFVEAPSIVEVKKTCGEFKPDEGDPDRCSRCHFLRKFHPEFHGGVSRHWTDGPCNVFVPEVPDPEGVYPQSEYCRRCNFLRSAHLGYGDDSAAGLAAEPRKVPGEE